MEKLAQKILKQAITLEAQDIYILPYENTYRVLARCQKTRKILSELTKETANQLMAHFKFVAGMNVGEKRRSQLGSCLYTTNGQEKRLRLSTVGDFEGKESLVIRLLHDQSQDTAFWLDGLSEARNVVTSRGLYLFSGPVGSGKTTLMHQLAREKFAEKQVISIEDPVEIVNPDFLQLQLNETIGNTYDALIKLSLRHMPDLVLVGEIRDEETAHAVLRASLTGYTVFSTIHAKSPKGVVARLLELGVTQGEIKNSLHAIIYQRIISGKGLLEVADADYEKWRSNDWNSKIEALLADGHISAAEAHAEKIDMESAN